MIPNGFKEVTDCYCAIGDHRVVATGAYSWRKVPKCPKHKGAMRVFSVETVRESDESTDCDLS